MSKNLGIAVKFRMYMAWWWSWKIVSEPYRRKNNKDADRKNEEKFKTFVSDRK